MGWDGTGMNCYGMGWDGTEKYVPWTSLKILHKVKIVKILFIKISLQKRTNLYFFELLSCY